ncbi:hypothetical protein BOX15_Mlig032656g1 [Macrostomum lignano]|uniref:IRS-type PTB domain-containing protein n=1 Tax=Macrostomum lignano TaxID=282301 RepID=A0A267FQH4_9PLAT|nr:hypothetical protein BOX15_Mlig032656g1 [Macrostomum lignano]
MPVPSSTVVIVSGPVRILINKKWKQRFCVIAKTPPYSASMKLFVYKEASDYKKSIDLVGQSPYDLVYGLDSEPAWKNERSSVRSILILTCHERLVLLGFSGPTELKPWHEKIAMTVQDASYRAKFSKCEAGCKVQPIPEGSEGRLHVQACRICFYPEPAEACKQLAVWELQFIKRYMVNESLKSFIFEGDIGCGKFRGMQYFACEQRQRVYTDMKAAYQNRPLSSMSAAADAPAFADRRPASLVFGSASAVPPSAPALHASQLRPPPGPPAASAAAAASSSCSIDIPQPHGSVSRRPHHHQHQHHQYHSHHFQHYHFQLLQQQRQLQCQHRAKAEAERASCASCCQAASEADTLFPFEQQAAQPQHRDYYNLRDRIEVNPTLSVTAPVSAGQVVSSVCFRSRTAPHCRDCGPPQPASAASAATAAGPSLIVRFTRSLSMNIKGSRTDSRSRLVRSSNDLRGACSQSVPGQVESSTLPAHEDAGSRQSGSHLSSAGGDDCCYCCDESAASASAASGHSPSSFGNSGSNGPAVASPAAGVTLQSSSSSSSALASSSAVGNGGCSSSGSSGGGANNAAAVTLATILEASAPSYIRSMSECQAAGPGHGRRSGCLPPLPPQQHQHSDRCPYINLATLSGPPATCSGQVGGANGGSVNLHYARLDHTYAPDSTAPQSVEDRSVFCVSGSDGSSMLDSLLLSHAELNYTELDHSKTRAFQEIVAEQGARRNPVNRSASAASGGGGGNSGGRRSFIRMFYRGSVKSD